MSTTLALEKLIEENRFYHYSQALYNSKDWTKIGSEIYLRSEYGEADMIFRQAKIVNKLFELETKSISKVLQTFYNEEIPIKYYLFINIFPSTILHQDFPKFIKKISNQYNGKRKFIVFEIVNTDYIEDFLLLKERINLLKDLGYLIAIDEIGKGWSSLDLIIELEPNFIKLDHFFSRNLSNSDKKQQMIKSLIQYAHHVGIKVILTGIEHEADLSIAKLLGVDICQGYLLDQPKPLIKEKEM